MSSAAPAPSDIQPATSPAPTKQGDTTTLDQDSRSHPYNQRLQDTAISYTMNKPRGKPLCDRHFLDYFNSGIAGETEGRDSQSGGRDNNDSDSDAEMGETGDTTPWAKYVCPVPGAAREVGSRPANDGV